MNENNFKRNLRNTAAVVVTSFIVLIIVCTAMGMKIRDIIEVHMEEHVAEQGQMVSRIIDNSFADEFCGSSTRIHRIFPRSPTRPSCRTHGTP